MTIRSISDFIRLLVSMDVPEGDVSVKKHAPLPEKKPPRRKPSIKNKSNREDYMKNYMKDYRENGKDYQKVPDKVKDWRREQKKKKESFDGEDIIALFGLGPKCSPPEPQKHLCPKCGKKSAIYKEIHPDTDMNDVVLVCSCGFSGE